MSHLLEQLPTVAAAIACFAGPAAFGLLLVLRAGPGRALALALNSCLARAPSPQSARAADVLALREALASTSQGRYVVVQGPKGVGETCVVETALQRTSSRWHPGRRRTPSSRLLWRAKSAADAR